MSQLIAAACSDLSAWLRPEHCEAMAAHWSALVHWDRTHNLTAITDEATAAWQHYRDSLAALAFLERGPILDMGSGGGFPGLPLAIVRSDWDFVLMEPRRKRQSFLTTIVARLGLSNVRILACRMEDPPSQTFAHVVTRATFSSDAALNAARRWLQPGGSLLAYRRAAQPWVPGCTRIPYRLQGEARALDILPQVGSAEAAHDDTGDKPHCST